MKIKNPAGNCCRSGVSILSVGPKTERILPHFFRIQPFFESTRRDLSVTSTVSVLHACITAGCRVYPGRTSPEDAARMLQETGLQNPTRMVRRGVKGLYGPLGLLYLTDGQS